MSDWAFGFATGIAVGLTIGLSFSRRQKPWAELVSKSHRLPQEAAEPVKIGLESAFRNQTFTQHNTMFCLALWPDENLLEQQIGNDII